MVFQNDIIAGASGAGGYTIDQSIRFDESGPAYLSRTLGTPTDGKTFTFSAWIKRGKFGNRTFLSASGPSYPSPAEEASFYIASEVLDVYEWTGSAYAWHLRADPLLRDPSAWYHLVLIYDSTEAESSNRVRLYTNGEQITSFQTASYPGLNSTTFINSAQPHRVGYRVDNLTPWDGYMAEIHFIDGQSLEPTSFGEYNNDGVWIPKAYAGTYGNNGFYITGADSADLGADESGNSNDFTSNNLTSDDQVTDTPTNNKLAWNGLQNQRGAGDASGITYKYTGSTRTLCGTTIHIPPTGKWIAALSVSSVADSDWQIGLLGSTDTDFGDATGSNEDVRVGFGPYPGSQYLAKNNTVASWYTGVTEDVNDTIWIAVDADNDEQWAGVYDDSASAMVWFGSGGTSGDIATRTNPTETGYIAAVGSVQFCACSRDSVVLTLLDIEDAPGYSSIPTDYKSLSTANLPAPTVADGSKYFNSYTWTGNGAGQRIASFQPITETYTIDNSCRFNDDDSARLDRTPSSAGNQKTWTWSGWIKRGSVSIDQIPFGTGGLSGTANDMVIWLHNDGSLRFYRNSSTILTTSAKYLDASTWYHVVLHIDTTNATADDRQRLWVNGAEVTAFATRNNLSLNTDYPVNSTIQHSLGNGGGSSSYYFDGYLADVHFIDGQALDASSFGQTDSSTNRWVPKAYTGSYGTNGFFLEFGDFTALGDDTSGNGNDFTSSGLASTDQMLDTPTKNYATLDPNEMSSAAGVTLKDGNLNADATATATDVNSTLYVTSGKWYVEYTINAADSSTSNPCVGIQTQSFATSPKINIDRTSDMTVNGTTTSLTGFSYTTSDIVMIAFDMDADKFWIGKNGTWYNSGDPGAGTGETTSFGPAGQAMTPFIRSRNASDVTINFGQSAFSYTAPTGFNQLNTDNLPLTGGNISAFSWIKSRSSALSHQLYDRVRGAGYRIRSDSTGAEYYDYDGLQEFLIDGFQLGSSTSVNTDGVTYVGWNWMTDVSGSGSTNEDGSITSTVLADATAGFSVVSYTGSGSGTSTVGHGLNSVPQVIIVKDRDSGATNWIVYPGFAEGYVSDPETDYLNLNDTGALADFNFWGDTAPTSSVFTVNSTTNAANNQIAYCFTEVPGFSRMANYVGNGNTDGTFVWCGFRPAFVMIKGASAAGRWNMYDSTRDPNNDGDWQVLDAQASDAESGLSGSDDLDLLSNGFKLRRNASNFNTSGVTYVFMAFAEHPFGGDGVAPVPAR